MGLKVIVCDDSKFARNQLIRVIPKSVISELHQASNGEEAMQLLHEGKGELLFLDLTMPIMDGFQVLEAIKQQNIDVMKIVVSGDIQQQVADIVNKYNVLAFIKKPMNPEELQQILSNYGLCDENDHDTYTIEQPEKSLTQKEVIDNKFDELKEKFNIATGQAASKIADILNLFITMPIPKISINKGGNIANELKSFLEIEENLVISQGFRGQGILGETLAFFSQEDINNYAHLMCDDGCTYKDKISQILELSALMSGTLIRVFGEQINTSINLTHPSKVTRITNNLTNENLVNSDILCIDLIYEIKDLNVQILYKIMFTEETAKNLQELLTFI